MPDHATLKIALSLHFQFGYARETLRGIIDAATPLQGFGKTSDPRRMGAPQWRLQLFDPTNDPGGHRQQARNTILCSAWNYI